MPIACLIWKIPYHTRSSLGPGASPFKSRSLGQSIDVYCVAVKRNRQNHVHSGHNDPKWSSWSCTLLTILKKPCKHDQFRSSLATPWWESGVFWSTFHISDMAGTSEVYASYIHPYPNVLLHNEVWSVSAWFLPIFGPVTPRDFKMYRIIWNLDLNRIHHISLTSKVGRFFRDFRLSTSICFWIHFLYREIQPFSKILGWKGLKNRPKLRRVDDHLR